LNVFFISNEFDFRFRDNNEIRQSTKHFKKYDRNNYKLEIKRCTKDDKGEYIVRASNSYGEKEYAVFLTVECKYHKSIKRACPWIVFEFRLSELFCYFYQFIIVRIIYLSVRDFGYSLRLIDIKQMVMY
jgi:hypothetical protein